MHNGRRTGIRKSAEITNVKRVVVVAIYLYTEPIQRMPLHRRSTSLHVSVGREAVEAEAGVEQCLGQSLVSVGPAQRTKHGGERLADRLQAGRGQPARITGNKSSKIE